MSPSYDNDFRLTDGLGQGRDPLLEEDDEDQVNKSPSNQSKTNSKGSPNEQKSMQMYRHLLAHQCLGDEVFNPTNSYQNLTSSALTMQQGFMNSHDILMQEEAKMG